MNDYPVIVSFFTKDWKYEKYANEMRQQCEELGLEHIITEKPSHSDYLKNCRMKPPFIKECITNVKKPVLWIDVDGCILKLPKFFIKLNVDFAAKKMAKTRARTWHVGTMWFNYTENCLNFLDKWIEYTENSCSDEEGLDRFWKVEKDMISTSDIPKEYFIIFGKKEIAPKDAVICHRISTGKDKMRLKRNKTIKGL